MLDYNPNIPLISIHIPKCGGTSFERVLKEWYGKRLFLHYYHAKKDLMPQKHDLRHRIFRWRYKQNICIHGHFRWTLGFGITDYYPEVQQYITILRDPFEQALSRYFFQKKRGEKRHVFGGNQLTLDEDFGDLESYLKETPSNIPEYFVPEISLDNYKDILEEKFVYIGLMEDLQTSVNKLAEKLSKMPITIPHLNISPKQLNLPDEAKIREEFRVKNELSYRLYQFAQEHYKQ